MKSKLMKIGVAVGLLAASAWTLAASIHADDCCDDLLACCMAMLGC